MKILVFPCGSEIGLELYRSLKFSTHVELWGGSSVEDHGRAVYKNYISDLPSVDSKEFIKEINEIARQYNFDYIFPAHDSVVLALARAQAANELRCKVITSPLNTCEIARSKRKTYTALGDIIRVPFEFTDHNPPTSFPVFLKPDVGQGSKGTRVIESKEEMSSEELSSSKYIIAEYLPGEEYTVDCFTNSLGVLMYAQARTRSRTANGISVYSKSIDDVEFHDIALSINKTLTFKGAWFFQVKRNADEMLVLLEIATRIAGTSGLSRALGVNLPLMSIFDAEGIDTRVSKNAYRVSIDRALYNSYSISIDYKHVYMDFDDLVVIDNKVNLKAIEFIYQCRNNSIPVTLLTKHADDINITLSNKKIDPGLFDSIEVIASNDKKYKYISNHHSIFIDDSFAERAEVHKHTGLPTFDAHMFEVLLEPFHDAIL